MGGRVGEPPEPKWSRLGSSRDIFAANLRKGYAGSLKASFPHRRTTTCQEEPSNKIKNNSKTIMREWRPDLRPRRVSRSPRLVVYARSSNAQWFLMKTNKGAYEWPRSTCGALCAITTCSYEIRPFFYLLITRGPGRTAEEMGDTIKSCHVPHFLSDMARAMP